MICFFCGEEITEGTGRIVPLDIPYVNLWAHRGNCAEAMDEEYLKENIERVYAYVDSLHKNKKNKKRGKKE